MFPDEPHTTYKRQAYTVAMMAAGMDPWAAVREAVQSTPDPYDGLIDADAEDT